MATGGEGSASDRSAELPRESYANPGTGGAAGRPPSSMIGPSASRAGASPPRPPMPRGAMAVALAIRADELGGGYIFAVAQATVCDIRGEGG